MILDLDATLLSLGFLVAVEQSANYRIHVLRSLQLLRVVRDCFSR